MSAFRPDQEARIRKIVREEVARAAEVLLMFEDDGVAEVQRAYLRSREDGDAAYRAIFERRPPEWRFGAGLAAILEKKIAALRAESPERRFQDEF